MKRHSKRRVMAWGFIFSFLVSCIVHGIYSTDQHLSFDSLFPKNSFAKATECCVQVWGSLDRILKTGGAPIQTKKILERSIGQLTLAQRYLEKSLHESKPSFDQGHYLTRVIGTVGDRGSKLFDAERERVNCLKDQIEKIKTFLENHFALQKESA